MEFLVNTTTSSTQQFPAVGSDAAGNFVITWSGDGNGDNYGVFLQRYDTNGNPLGGETLVNTTTPDWQIFPTLAMNTSGEFVITWDALNQDGDGMGIYARRYDATGSPLGSEFPVNTITAGEQNRSAVAIDANANFVIAWSGNGPGDTSGIFARRYDAGGNALDVQEFLVNSYTTDIQEEAAVAVRPTGEFVISWTSHGQDTETWGVYGQKFDVLGTPQGSEFPLNSTSSGDQYHSWVGMDDGGDIVAVWSGEGTGDPDGIFGQIFQTSTIHQISGIVFEDSDFAGTATNWDGGSGDAALPNVDVELYDDTDSYISSVITDGAGGFTFGGLTDGTYKVRARSVTVGDADTPPAAGFNPTVPAVWPYPLPDLTWGHNNTLIGGQVPSADDTETADDAGPGDTYVTVSVYGGDVLGVNFGFCFELITNEDDDGNPDNARSKQGTLRQFIKNANAIVGTNRSQFQIPGL